jgi:multiple sugar transport system substrate-binding protein
MGSLRRVRGWAAWLVVACVALPGCGPRPAVVALALLPSELPVVRAALDEFERASGERLVVVAQQYPEIRRALAAEAGGGAGALDLVELDVHSLALAAGHARALELGALGGELDAGALRAGRFEGLRFAPYRLSWQALLYDATVLTRPPGTWAELLEVARAHSGRIGLKGSRYEGLTCDVLPFVWQAGGDGVRLDEPAARLAFRFLASLAPHLHPHAASFKEASVAEAMARGELVLHLNWPFAMHLYAAHGLAPARIRSAPLPAGPAGRATVLGGGYLGVPVNAPHRELALRLLRHLLSRDVQERFARELGWFSPRRDVALEAGEGGLLAGFAASRGDVRPRPERADYARLSRHWQDAFRAVAFEGADPDGALRGAARAFERAGR